VLHDITDPPNTTGNSLSYGMSRLLGKEWMDGWMNECRGVNSVWVWVWGVCLFWVIKDLETSRVIGVVGGFVKS
jgi:hypothetical protein